LFKGIACGTIVTIFLISVFSLAANIKPVKPSPTTIVVPDDYPTIQEAINAANPSDIIFVRSGNYYENVVVNKSVSMIGENRQNTIIDGSGSGTALDITVNNVNLTNFTIQNSGGSSAVGIRLKNVDHCNISYNNIVNSAWGMNVYYSSNNIISKNNISNTGFGMELEHSNYTIIYKNNIIENCMGIWLEQSLHNIISSNKVINSSSWGIFLGFSSKNNTISQNNLVSNQDHGVHLMDSSNNNSILRNNIIANYYGVFIYASSYNKFYHNNFINNTEQVYFQDSRPNFWDDGYPSGGNYWSDSEGDDIFSGPYQNETGSDGIVDVPYIIDTSNVDRYPLHNPWPTFYEFWKISFIGLGGYPVVDFAIYNGSLYAVAGNMLYVYSGEGWSIAEAPTFVVSFESYQSKLILGGKGGLYSFDGTIFNLILSVPTYIRVLGVYNNTLYAGTMLDRSPTLYYCRGSAANPMDWHEDASFSAILNFSDPFSGIDSFAVYNNKMYVSSGGTVYCFNGTGWSIAKVYADVCAFLDMQVYNGKLYLATRDQAWRKPVYQGGTGFSGRVIEFDGSNWATVLDHYYWIYSLETFDNKLYVGTANKIYTYNGIHWNVSFRAEDGAYYAISFINFNNSIYVGMGNGYIFVDPSPETVQSETVMIPEFLSFLVLPLFTIMTLLAVLANRKSKHKLIKEVKK